jgi:hypothetical protein
MTPEEAEHVIRQAADAFAAGHGSIQDLFRTFHGHLHDLCRDEPLHGSFLALFQALEAWEVTTGDRAEAERSVAAAAGSLAD